jgi:hypothetical protein
MSAQVHAGMQCTPCSLNPCAVAATSFEVGDYLAVVLASQSELAIVRTGLRMNHARQLRELVVIIGSMRASRIGAVLRQAENAGSPRSLGQRASKTKIQFTGQWWCDSS